jgi:hypothetical protein
MSGKKACINYPSSFYTGKEQSPLHFGLSAEGYEVNAIMEGFDTELWIVEVRNNKKVWTKKEYINKLTYEKPVINDILRTVNNDTTVNQENTADNTNSSAATNSNGKNKLDDAEISNGEPDNDAVNSKNKASKTIKPTDYTLFITYRIHQMKKESTDNKKNYDCARYEWKEYKKKPDELNAIMIEANNFVTNKNVN